MLIGVFFGVGNCQAEERSCRRVDACVALQSELENLESVFVKIGREALDEGRRLDAVEAWEAAVLVRVTCGWTEEAGADYELSRVVEGARVEQDIDFLLSLASREDLVRARSHALPAIAEMIGLSPETTEGLFSEGDDAASRALEWRVNEWRATSGGGPKE